MEKLLISNTIQPQTVSINYEYFLIKNVDSTYDIEQRINGLPHIYIHNRYSVLSLLKDKMLAPPNYYLALEQALKLPELKKYAFFI